jgi:translation initiation factor 2B subunit (eIF-2B alpha/beta/delta family)
MVVIVSIISNMKFKEAEAARQQIEEEQQEFMDSQLKLQEEIERLARESLTINQDDMQS